ncbi:MAG: YlbF family regulator [Bacilli bacterium]|nr:YlbF family regulator [Bacilli bacterium]
MEKYLSNETEKSLEELINYIKNSHEYIECMKLKEKISEDKDLMLLIDDVRKSQKNYIKSNYDKDKKIILDEKIKLLDLNSLYVMYSYYLEQVNYMINLIKDELNDYFFEITNILK